MTARLIKRVAPPQEQTLRRVRPPAAPRRLGEPPQDRLLLDTPQSATPLRAAPLMATAPVRLTSAELATGRGLTYEWEDFMADVLDRVGTLEQGIAPPLSYVHTQTGPAATWSIVHNLGTKPTVVIVADDGSELFAEVDYPDNLTTVITFGQPYSGSAYLRG